MHQTVKNVAAQHPPQRLEDKKSQKHTYYLLALVVLKNEGRNQGSSRFQENERERDRRDALGGTQE